MQYEIKKYPVQHALLKNYIKFFWEFRVDHLQLNHKLIPQRNINLRFNLTETPHILSFNNKEHLLENIYFSGIQDHFTNAHLKLAGSVHSLGVCFSPGGFFPFFKIPVAEFKNQILGAREIGYKKADHLNELIRNATNTTSRLNILENEFVKLLSGGKENSERILKILNHLKNCPSSRQISEFCSQNNMSMRKLERMFNKYIGVSASTFCTLNRFHICMNRLLYKDFSKLSDLAYDQGYFDQMHFIKDFKRFAGNSPKNFIKQSDSILQIGKLV